MLPISVIGFILLAYQLAVCLNLLYNYPAFADSIKNFEHYCQNVFKYLENDT